MTLKPIRSAGQISPKTLQQFRIAALLVDEANGTLKASGRKWLATVPEQAKAEARSLYVVA